MRKLSDSIARQKLRQDKPQFEDVTLSEIYKVDFEIIYINGKPLSVFYYIAPVLGDAAFGAVHHVVLSGDEHDQHLGSD